ncbi:MAG: redoxin domain-containing protein [Pirellulales bacterium]
MRKPRRMLRMENLESRHLCAADWQNVVNSFDVNQSGSVEPLDALIVVNDLNEHGVRTLSPRPEDYSGPLCDVNGDGQMSPIDALLVMNSFSQIEVGDVAPAVRLPNQDGEIIDLASFIGQSAVVLYFYPKDNTPGCTIEALDFSDRKQQIESLGAKLFGVSLDSVESHDEFAADHELSFDILADENRQVTMAYGVLTQINDMPIARRTTFIIGADGIIKQVFTDVDVHIHGGEVVAALQAGVAN